MQSEIHESLTFERVQSAVLERMFGLENPGFCLACGADHDGCEPDASGYDCYECGEPTVEGADNVLMMIGR